MNHHLLVFTVSRILQACENIFLCEAGMTLLHCRSNIYPSGQRRKTAVSGPVSGVGFCHSAPTSIAPQTSPFVAPPCRPSLSGFVADIRQRAEAGVLRRRQKPSGRWAPTFAKGYGGRAGGTGCKPVLRQPAARKTGSHPVSQSPSARPTLPPLSAVETRNQSWCEGPVPSYAKDFTIGNAHGLLHSQLASNRHAGERTRLASFCTHAGTDPHPLSLCRPSLSSLFVGIRRRYPTKG